MSEFDVLDIHSIMQELAKKRPIFHSEADFQFALAWHIKETVPQCEIRLEWKPFLDENLHLDMWLPTHSTAIELKYPVTASLDIWHGDERFMPRIRRRSQAQYGFVKDIERIERMVDHDKVERGFAVLLTNHEGFWKPPKSSSWRDTDSANFRIHHGMELKDTRHWLSKRKPSTKKSPVELRESYEMFWRDYCDLETVDNIRIHKGNRFKFRYLAVEVSK